MLRLQSTSRSYTQPSLRPAGFRQTPSPVTAAPQFSGGMTRRGFIFTTLGALALTGCEGLNPFKDNAPILLLEPAKTDLMGFIRPDKFNGYLNQIPASHAKALAQKAYEGNYELWEAGFIVNPKDLEAPYFYLITTPPNSLADRESLTQLNPSPIDGPNPKPPPRVFYGPLDNIQPLTVTRIGSCRCPGPMTLDTAQKVTFQLPIFPYLDGPEDPRVIYPENTPSDARPSVLGYRKLPKYRFPETP